MKTKHLLWLLMQFDIHRYLMCNAKGRFDGSEKADRHEKLCKTFIAAFFGCEVDRSCRDYLDEKNIIHDATQYLTDFMDEEIGFPVDTFPDYDKLAPLFFDKFIKLSTEALEKS